MIGGGTGKHKEKVLILSNKIYTIRRNFSNEKTSIKYFTHNVHGAGIAAGNGLC